MKNLIIGSKGFLGRELCKFLKNRNESVVEIDIKNGSNEDARFIKLPLDNIDRVYFLAWNVGGSKFLYNANTQIIQMEWNNALMNNIFPQIINTPFVFVSSQLSDNIDSVYGIQKKMGEVWTKLSNYGISVRLWNIYGYNEKFTEKSHVVSDFVYQAMINSEIKMLTKGNEVRQYIHIDDACDGLIKSFDITDKNKTYDISTGEWVKLLDLANEIKHITNCKIILGEKLGESLLIKNKQFIPNWKPKISLYDGLNNMIKNFKND